MFYQLLPKHIHKNVPDSLPIDSNTPNNILACEKT